MSEARTKSMNVELYEYKQKVVSLLSSSTEITEALNSDVDDSELVYSNIFPYGKNPETQTDSKCYITIQVTMPQVSTKNYFFKDVLLIVQVICHDDLIRADEYGMPRTDYLSAKICALLNGNVDFGYGEMELVSNTEGPFAERYYHRTRRFQTQEQSKTNLCV